MTKRIIALVLSSLCLVPVLARAQALAENAPSSYTVVKGDTLWGIAGKFLKEPFRWPEIWNMNKEQIKDPHWIYPGDVIRLDITAEGKPRLSLDTSPGSTLAGTTSADGTIKVIPRVRVERLAEGIASIPGAALSPFLGQPLVVEENGLTDSPKIVAAEESRVVIGSGTIAYVDFIDPALGTKWQVYRQGQPLRDPDTREILGYTAIFLGDARVTRYGSPSTIEVVRAVQEINRGDRLTPTRENAIPSYSPRAPEAKITGKIMAVDGNVAEMGQYSVIAINRGKRDGLEIGHVLATHRAGEVVSTRDPGSSMNMGLGGLSGIGSGLGNLWNKLKPNPVVADAPAAPASTPPSTTNTAKNASEVKLPDERNGLVFVFRVFDRVSYALVMQIKRPIYVNDIVQTP